MASLDPESDEIKANIAADKLIAQCYFKEEELGKWPKITHPVFKEWQDLMSRLTYSRIPFHFASLLPVLSMSLNRRVNTKIGKTKLYANVNVMAAGISTISGKSFAASNCLDEFKPIIIEANYQNELNSTRKITMMDQTNSAARFVQNLVTTNNILWYYDEAKTFFDEAESWNKPIIPELNHAYECKTVSRGLSKKPHQDGKPDFPDKCETPFVSLLFNMTMMQLKDVCTGGLYSSGFTPRWLWFIETGGELRKNVTITVDEENRINALKLFVYNTSKILYNLPYDSITFGINDKIEDWKITTSLKYGDSEFHQTAVGRTFINMYKIAMILSVFDKNFQEKIFGKQNYPILVELPDKWVTEAMRICDQYLFPRTVQVLNMSKTEEVTKKQVNRQVLVLDKLKELHGVATKSQLLRATALSARDLDESLQTLTLSGQVTFATKRNMGPGGKLSSGPKVTYYCLVNGDKVGQYGAAVDGVQ
jgi:hypothetical protein